MKYHVTLILLFFFPVLGFSETRGPLIKDEQKKAVDQKAKTDRDLEALKRKYSQAIKKGDIEAARALGNKMTQPQPLAVNQDAYISKITKGEEALLYLANQAAVKLTEPVVDFAVMNNNCVLFKEGADWNIWIEGKKSYKCELLRAPRANPVGYTRVTVRAVEQTGEFVRLLDGRTFKVNATDEFEAMRLNPPGDALLLDNSKLVILSEGKDVTVRLER